MKKRMFLTILALLIVFGGIAVAKYLQIKKGMAMASQPQPPAVIAATEVKQSTWQSYLQAVGSLTASQAVTISNQVAGKVAEILFEDGQSVAAGDILIRLDTSVDSAELDGYIAAEQRFKIAFDRANRLITATTISQSDYDTVKAEYDGARAAVAAKRAFIDRMIIRAPFAGRLGIRQVDLGEYLKDGTPIVPLQALDPMQVDYTLPERVFADVTTGRAVQVIVQAYPDATFAGEIIAINPGVDAASRSFKLRARLPNADGRLRDGMFAEVRTTLPDTRSVLTVPQTAIDYNPYGASVFLIIEKDQQLIVERKQVETGEVRDGQVEIVGGLELGQKVVSAGQVKLRNGMAVTIDNGVQLSGKELGP